MNENERPLSGWTTEDLRSEMKRLEKRNVSSPPDDTLSVLNEFQVELSFRERHHIIIVSRFLVSADGRSLNRSDHRRKKRSFWIECESCGRIIDLRKCSLQNSSVEFGEEVPAK